MTILNKVQPNLDLEALAVEYDAKSPQDILKLALNFFRRIHQLGTISHVDRGTNVQITNHKNRHFYFNTAFLYWSVSSPECFWSLLLWRSW